MDDFRDSLGAKLRVGDLVVVGFKEGNSTPSVGIMKVAELMPKDRWEPRVRVIPIDGAQYSRSYRYCDRVMRIDALAVKADQLLEEHS